MNHKKNFFLRQSEASKFAARGGPPSSSSIVKRIFVQNLMHLSWRRKNFKNEQNFYTNGARTAYKFLHQFGVSASLLTSELLSDFHYLFHPNCVFISGYNGSAFRSVD